MEKITIAKKNEILRGLAFEKIIKEGILGEDLLQVAGSKYMTNVEYDGIMVPVRIDFVVPKIEEEDTCLVAEDFAEEYAQAQEQKRLDKEQKRIAKEKKIARDKKLREEKRLAKEQAKQEKGE